MASYEQVLKFENEKPQGVLRLVEANGFYRAYNHSAFLFHQVIAQHKVTRKFAKNINQEIVYVGFPVEKLLERIGGRSHQKTDFGYDVALSETERPDDANYDEWRRTVPKEVASHGDVNALSVGHFTELFDLSEDLSKQLASWQKFSQRQTISDANVPPVVSGRSESVGSRFGGAYQKANPMMGAAASSASPGTAAPPPTRR